MTVLIPEPYNEDIHELYLDTVVALSLDIDKLTEDIIEISDEPPIVRRAIKARNAARRIHEATLEYRPKLANLKRKRTAQ